MSLAGVHSTSISMIAVNTALQTTAPHPVTAHHSAVAQMVLGIDELLNMILQNADMSTIKACVRCCRRWRAIGKPSLWKQLVLTTCGQDRPKGFLQKIIRKAENRIYLDLDSLGTIQSIPKKFLQTYPDTLCYVRHIQLDLAMPYNRSSSFRDLSHFLGQIYIVGILISLCPQLRSLDVRVGLSYKHMLTTHPHSETTRMILTNQTTLEDALIPASVEPATRAYNPYSSSDDIFDEADEESIIKNVSYVLMPAIRILDVSIQKCNFQYAVDVAWSLNFPFSKPSQIIMSAVMTTSTLNDANDFVEPPHHMDGNTTFNQMPSLALSSDLSEMPISSVIAFPTQSRFTARISRFDMLDASLTNPAHLANLLKQLVFLESFSITNASMPTTVISMLERHASTLRLLALKSLTIFDDTTFFNSFLTKSSRLEKLDISGSLHTPSAIMFKVEIYPLTMQTGFACTNLRSLNVNYIPHLGNDFFSCLGKSCKMLQDLSCRHNPHVTDGVLSRLANECRFLRRLDLNGCVSVTIEGITLLEKAALLCLESVAIEDIPRVLNAQSKDPKSIYKETQIDIIDAIVDLAMASPKLYRVEFGRPRRGFNPSMCSLWILQHLYCKIHCDCITQRIKEQFKQIPQRNEHIKSMVAMLYKEYQHALEYRKHKLGSVSLQRDELVLVNTDRWILQLIRNAINSP